MKKCRCCNQLAVLDRTYCQKHLKIERHRQYAERIVKGICTQCDSRAVKNRTTCHKCAEHAKRKVGKRRKAGLCAQCDKRAVKGLFVCKEHRNRYAHRHKRNKIVLLIHYGKGGKMKCCWYGCDVIDPDMLTIDHIDDDGAECRRQNGNDTYGYIIREDFPRGFQTLCFNHQWKKRIVGLREDAK